MGKRNEMAHIPLEELRHLDHAVFGQLVIATQSTSEIKEASMFIEKPRPDCRKFEKAKSDNAIMVQRQTIKAPGLLNSPLPAQKSRTTSDLKYSNETKPKNGQIAQTSSLKQWLSAEFPAMQEQRKMSGDYFDETPKYSTLPPFTNGHRSFQRTVSQNSSLSPNISVDELTNDSRNLSISKRKSHSFYGSSSLSRESSIEEETEGEDSVRNENGKQRSGKENNNNRRVSHLVDELLLDIYGKWYGSGVRLPFNRRRRSSSPQESDYCSTSGASTSWKAQAYQRAQGMNDSLQRSRLRNKSAPELVALVATLRSDVQYAGSLLVRQLKRRDALISRRDKQNDVITAFLQALSEKRSQDTRIRYSVMPYPGDSGFTQWHDAMKMVARLPGGIPPEFRRRLWLTLAEKHLQARSVDWSHAERFCFNEWSNPDDDELGVQIVKDLHRTGCSLFCGAAAEENQALLKRVLLAYARWNKAVGYCQGFNMLAALILQVMDRSETDSVKVMIYLIEGVLPESYFANNLRGLSVDMAVFRDLLRLRLPTLSRHLEQLQHDARDTATGTSYEPPLTNVFTMQWFLTLFSNCLPQPTVLRVWDLIFLEGNEVLLRTALAIWDGLADRIMAVDSADEFYSIMGVLTREMLEFGLMDTNNLVKTIVTIAPFPFPELPELRDKYLYNITPWTHTVSTAARRGLRLFYSDDDDDGTDEDDEKIAVAAAYGISAVFRSPRRRDSMNRAPSPSSSLSAINYSPAPPDRDRLALDISALKQQYTKLRERQRQAHIILTAACARQPLGPSAPTPVAMNHLLLGKSALLSVRGRRGGPPPGAVPPPASIALKSAPKPHRGRQQLHVTTQGQLITPSNVEVVSPQIQQQQGAKTSGETLHWKDATRRKQRRGSQQEAAIEQSIRSVDDNETQGVRNEATVSRGIPVIKEPKPRTDDVGKKEDVESDDSKSSSSTELCDEPDRLSDFDSEEPTSISDISSHIPSTGEAIVTKLPSPSPGDKSSLPTPESIAPQSPLEHDISLLKPNSIIMSKSREFISSETTPSVISPLVKPAGIYTESVDIKPPDLQQPLLLGKESKVTEKKLPAEGVVDAIATFSATEPEATADRSESLSVQTENFELTSETQEFSPAADVIDLKFSPLKEVSMCETTPQISLDVVELSFSEDKFETVSPNESISIAKDEKPESPGKTDVSDVLEQASSATEKSPVTTSKLFESFHTSELKMENNEKADIDEIILKEHKDRPCGFWIPKNVEEAPDVFGKEEFDTDFTAKPVLPAFISEVSQLESQIEETERNISTELKSMRIADSSVRERSPTFEISQENHWDTEGSLKSESFQCLHNLQDSSPKSLQLGSFSPTASIRLLQDDTSRTVGGDSATKAGAVETKEELKPEIRIEWICIENSVPEIEGSCVAFGDLATSDARDIEQTGLVQVMGHEEDRSVSLDDSEDVSKLLELNQRLQDRERVIKDVNGGQTCEVENISDRETSDIDYAEISDLLEMDQNVNLGRRNSERALKIIQENSEILQRILQCQARRPSKLSEEESNGGTTTIPSEADSNQPSIPTSSSAENVDITSCQQTQTVSDIPKTDSSDSCILAVMSPKDGVSDKSPSEVSLSSPILPWTPISSHSFPKSDHVIRVSPDLPQSKEGMYIELKSSQLVNEEHDKINTSEHFDSHHYSIPVMPEEFLKAHDFSDPWKDENQVPTLSLVRRFSLSSEIPNNKDSRFSLDYGIVKPKTETSDITQVLRPVDEQFLSHSEDRTTTELTGLSKKNSIFSLDSETVKPKTETAVITQQLHPADEKFLPHSEDRTSSELITTHSSFPIGDHVERRVHRPVELELHTERFSSAIQSSWKRFPTLDSSLSESLSSKFPKHFSPETMTHTSYSSYNSKGSKDNLHLLDSPIKPVTETKSLTSVKWINDDDDDDFRTEKHVRRVESPSGDSRSHLDRSFSKFSRDSSPSSSWFLDKSKLKDDSSTIKSTCDSHDLSHPGSSYSAYSSDLNTSKPYTSISRYEYSPTRTKARNTDKESNIDYFKQHDSSKYTESPSSWSTKDSTAHPLDSFTFKSSSDRTEISPVDDYQQKSSYSSKKRHAEEFQYSYRPDATSIFDYGSGTQDVVRRTTTRDHSRPHSTIISDITSTEILNRSYSSSSIDGYLTRTRQDLSSPPASPDHGQSSLSSFRSVLDESSSLGPDKSESSAYTPIHEMDSSRRGSTSLQYRHSFKSPRKNEFESKLSSKDLSPPSYSSFLESRWNKDDPSASHIKSQSRKESPESQSFSTGSSLAITTLSKTKVGKSYSPTVSPTKSKDIHVSLPPIKSSSLGSPTRTKSTFDPFPPRPTMRQPKELGIKLGLYSTDNASKNGKSNK